MADYRYQIANNGEILLETGIKTVEPDVELSLETRFDYIVNELAWHADFLKGEVTVVELIREKI